MSLSRFAVVHERGADTSRFDDPLVHCYDGEQLVLAFIGNTALSDYFCIPGDQHPSLRDWNLVVDRNLDSFGRIIAAKYQRGEKSAHNTYGQTYPRVDVTAADMQRGGEELTADVLKLKAGYVARPA